MAAPMTEIVENKEVRLLNRPVRFVPTLGTSPARGWILYDGQCRYCIAAAKKFERLFGRRGFDFLPLQTPWVQERLGLDPEARLEEMRVLTAAGDDFAGAAAIVFLMKQVWWARPFYFLARQRGINGFVDQSYRWIAAHRGCTHVTGSGTLCRIPSNGTGSAATVPPH